jgi:hypothetical protein
MTKPPVDVDSDVPEGERNYTLHGMSKEAAEGVPPAQVYEHGGVDLTMPDASHRLPSISETMSGRSLKQDIAGEGGTAKSLTASNAQGYINMRVHTGKKLAR